MRATLVCSQIWSGLKQQWSIKEMICLCVLIIFHYFTNQYYVRVVSVNMVLIHEYGINTLYCLTVVLY